jgi:hypothetical protein
MFSSNNDNKNWKDGVSNCIISMPTGLGMIVEPEESLLYIPTHRPGVPKTTDKIRISGCMLRQGEPGNLVVSIDTFANIYVRRRRRHQGNHLLVFVVHELER